MVRRMPASRTTTKSNNDSDERSDGARKEAVEKFGVMLACAMEEAKKSY